MLSKIMDEFERRLASQNEIVGFLPLFYSLYFLNMIDTNRSKKTLLSNCVHVMFFFIYFLFFYVFYCFIIFFFKTSDSLNITNYIHFP